MRREKMKKGKNLIAILLCLAMSYIPMQAAGYYKNKKVQYGGVNLYYNGVYQNAAAQAVVIDGTTYLPIKALGNMLGVNVSWNQGAQAVMVNGSNSPLSNQAEIQAKDYEIQALKKELETLKNQGVITGTTSSSSSSNNNYTSTSGKDISSSEVSATRRALQDKYGDYFNDIDFDFSLSVSSDKLKVNISVDRSSDYRAFNRLSRNQVRNFVENVCEYIRDRHDDIAISGIIEYSSSDKELYSFSYSRNNSLSFSRSSYSSYYDTEEEELLSILNRRSSLSIAGCSSSVSIDRRTISTENSRERVNCDIYLNITDEIRKAWNDHTGINNDSTLRSELRSIANDLDDETNYDIRINLINASTGSSIGYYVYEDNDLQTYSI